MNLFRERLCCVCTLLALFTIPADSR